METRTIRLSIDIYGKAPSKYGPNAYKVGLAARPLLVRDGWEHAGSGKGYEYVRSTGGKIGKRVIIEVEIPTEPEIKRIAMAMHAERKARIQQILGFVVRYQPAGEIIYQMMEPVATESVRWDDRKPMGEPVRRRSAEFEFGVSGPWSVELVWDCGDDADPTWCRHESAAVMD